MNLLGSIRHPDRKRLPPFSCDVSSCPWSCSWSSSPSRRPPPAPATSHAYTLGVSDQQASTFTNPLFAPLKFKAARYITPYDVMDSPSDLSAAQAWISAAQGAHQRVLIAFERSHRSGRERHLPSVAEYKREITKFHKAFPSVKEISVWNEVNRCQSRSRVAGQPTCGKEQRLASYFKTARSVFRSSGTKIVALDVLD